MNLQAEQQDYEAAGAMAHELPYWGWLTREPFCLTRAGELLAVARLRPAILDGRTPGQLDQVLDRWQRLLSQLPAGSRFYFYFLRRPLTLEPIEGLDGVAAVSQRRRRDFLGQRLLDLQTYVVWSHNPGLRQATRQAPGLAGSALGAVRAWIQKRRNPDARAFFRLQVDRAAAQFRQVVDASSALVDDITPIDFLRPREANAFLNDLINRPGTPLGGGPDGSGLNWRLSLSELEAERRHLRLDDEPVLLYSMLSPPVQARANLLHDLFQLQANFTLSIEWRPKATQTARNKIRSVQRAHFSKRYSAVAHMQETDGTASAMVDATADAESSRLAAALVELEADGVAYGEISLTIALHGPLEEIEGRDAELRRIFAAADAKLIREGFGQIPAWFSRLPGQPPKRQLRKIFVSAGVTACLAPLFGPAHAPSRSKHLDRPALALFETPWNSAFPYDLYGGGGGDVGHTLILGATGSGKSFLLNFLLVQAQQYDPKVLILDLGGSYRWLTDFLGGGYIELSPDNPDAGVALRPFALPPGDRTFQFLTGWITRLLRIGGYNIGGADTNELRARVEDLYAFEPERRTMTAFVRSLPHTMWPAMSRWYGSGPWATYFDNPEGEEIQLDDWQVIDLAGASEHDDLCEAALFYLLERLRLSIDDPDEVDRVKLMVVDEAWKYLQDEAVLAYLAEAAKTWRKRNAALVLATQSAVDVTATPGASALLESMPTKLFLANPDLPQEVQNVFRLNDTEMDRIRGLIPKRELYLRRANLAAVMRLFVDPESYWLYTSHPADAARRAAAVAEHGLERALQVLANGG